LFHSNVKREWNFEHRCHLQSTTPELSASRNTRPHGRSGSQALPYNKEVERDKSVLGQCAQFGKHLITPLQHWGMDKQRRMQQGSDARSNSRTIPSNTGVGEIRKMLG
jgi:hypothetical protein